MLSSQEIEKLIAKKKRDIFEEKVQLGIVPIHKYEEIIEDTENSLSKKQVSFKEDEVSKISPAAVPEQNVNDDRNLYDIEEPVISGELERYIRRYIGLPGMLKAGEFSPNNPLVRGERSALCGDALLGLGEYERRRNTLRKIRQAQYREHLDRQAKKKQEAKEDAERERREQERKDREREERERQLLLERERFSPERRASVDSTYYGAGQNKVDTAVQVGLSSPLSVAVQTDDTDLYRHPEPISPCKLTTAERELSPHTVGDVRPSWSSWDARRRSYGDFDERTSTVRKSNREKLQSDLRHSYMPSIFDADAIQMRNEAAEKEAAERRQFYQQELKNQIREQQRIREERKSREKLLEQAEMRRLEEQLRMLREAQEKEIGIHQDILTAAKTNAKEYETKRTELQRDIDSETLKLRAASHPARNVPNRPINTSSSDTKPFTEKYHQGDNTFQPIDKKPYSFNIPANSLFSPNYDVDSYLRKNLNFNKHVSPRKETAETKSTETQNEYRVDRKNSAFDIPKDDFKQSQGTQNNKRFETEFRREKANDLDLPIDTDLRYQNDYRKKITNDRQFLVDKALVHEPRAEKPKTLVYDVDSLCVPVLRHSPRRSLTDDAKTNLSDAMKKVDEKWQVPAVQKNILKSLPSEGGNISILTQLGSIRRQLQLEQLRLDKMLQKE